MSASTMKHFVFCHGFGFKKDFWHNLAPYFQQEKCTYLDLGYFAAPATHIEHTNDLLIGVGHSLGLIKLLTSGKKFDCLIGLNSFVNFLGNDQILRAKRTTELHLFKKMFTKFPLNTLDEFYQRCGIPSFLSTEESNKINIDNMLADLHFLTTCVAIPKSTPIFIIGTANDFIAPPELLRDNFANQTNIKLEIIPQGKHGLGFIAAAAIHKKIMSFIDEFAENKN